MNPLPAGTGDPIDRSCSGFVGAPDRGPMRTDGPLADCRSLAKRILKGIGIALGMAVAILPATTCWAEARLRSGRDEFFLLWGQAFALVPGLPGKYLRRCFYALTLR